MANLWLDLKGPILADTVYINGVLVAKDVTITLPAVTHVTADYKAMGPYTAPMTGQIEGMEAAITKIGIDKGLRSMVQLESKTLEVRWAQDVKYADGSSKTEGCKAFGLGGAVGELDVLRPASDHPKRPFCAPCPRPLSNVPAW